MRDSIANLPLANCMVLTSVCAGQSNSPPDCLDLNGFESQSEANKKRHPNGWRFLLAEDEGFEPPQTESESGVLPLHKSSIWWRQQDSNL